MQTLNKGFSSVHFMPAQQSDKAQWESDFSQAQQQGMVLAETHLWNKKRPSFKWRLDGGMDLAVQRYENVQLTMFLSSDVCFMKLVINGAFVMCLCDPVIAFWALWLNRAPEGVSNLEVIVHKEVTFKAEFMEVPVDVTIKQQGLGYVFTVTDKSNRIANFGMI